MDSRHSHVALSELSAGEAARDDISLVVAAGTLAAALPGGVRDAGVRAVDRAEAGLRRWALFVGGAGFLFRVLLWH